MMYKTYVKRFIDVVGALILLPFVLCLCGIVGLCIFWDDRGEIFYRAPRRGLHGCIFTMYKFRSMKMNAPDIRNPDNSTYNAVDDPRITRVGKWLRKTSIDEIPQILNVLNGDMSFIGPRPITINRPLSDYDEKRRIRLHVKPGITGYSQAYYRNSIDQETKLQYDAFYAQNLSFWIDLKILFKTIETVLLRKNIYKKG
ncbi:sugar transferase [Gallibacterium anatis]|uniref:sugar transferase n=2 Tax=Gallibacterium anatis TaxID=750 RepID=UPI0030057A4C